MECADMTRKQIERIFEMREEGRSLGDISAGIFSGNRRRRGEISRILNVVDVITDIFFEGLQKQKTFSIPGWRITVERRKKN